jgi:hypothetical protein
MKSDWYSSVYNVSSDNHSHIKRVNRKLDMRVTFPCITGIAFGAHTLGFSRTDDDYCPVLSTFSIFEWLRDHKNICFDKHLPQIYI